MRLIVCVTFPDRALQSAQSSVRGSDKKLEPRCHGEGLFASSHAVEPCGRTLSPAHSFVCVPLVCADPPPLALPQTSALLEKRPPRLRHGHRLHVVAFVCVILPSVAPLCSLATRTRADVLRRRGSGGRSCPRGDTSLSQPSCGILGMRLQERETDVNAKLSSALTGPFFMSHTKEQRQSLRPVCRSHVMLTAAPLTPTAT